MDAGDWTRGLVERLGGHPAATLGLDLDASDDLGRWLVAACLLAGRAEEARALAAWRALADAGLDAPSALAGADPARVEAALAAARYPRAESAAAILVRASRALAQRHGGSLEALAAEAGSLEELAGAVARLAPGLGAAKVWAFLRPLRGRWAVATEVPLAPAARAAAEHLGLLREGEDAEGEPGALRAALRDAPGAPALPDVEAALERLGARACARGRPERCPLGRDCPRRREPKANEARRG